MKKRLIPVLVVILFAVCLFLIFSALRPSVQDPQPSFAEILPITAQFPQAELQLAAYCATEENSGAASTQYFTLDDSKENQIISDKVIFEHTTVQSIELSIDTCMWVPHTCDVQLGLYDVDTGNAWYYEFSGGSVSGTYSFPDMPEGNYIVFVRNVSSSTITDGSIRYSVS